MGAQRRRGVLDAVSVVAAAVALTLVLDVFGLPSPALFGGLLAGLVRALAFPSPGTVPESANTAALAVVGVSIGALLDPDTLREVAGDWAPILLVVVATLALSVVAGLLLRLRQGISPVTGAFSMIAGGAAGITAMARALGADERLVAGLQYLRVLLIVSLMPIAATLLYGARPGAGGPTPIGDVAWPAGPVFTATCAVLGVVLGRLARLPAAAVLGPMLVAAAASLGGVVGQPGVPELLEAAAFLVIGLQVGLSFTRRSLRTIGGALPLALVIVVALIAACAGLGAVLSGVTGASALDGYLATTPGGMVSVLAVASDSGADSTFVLVVQVLRMFVMVLSAPLIARWLRRARPSG